MTHFKPFAPHHLLIACLALAVPSTVAAGVAGIDFSHNDWTIACDNTRTCRAAGYQADEDEWAVSLLLTRKAGPGAPVAGRVMLGQYEESAMPEGLALHIDDRDLGVLRFDRGEGIAELSTAQVESLIAALRRDSTIVFVGDEPTQRWRPSDKGATAVLLKMDEFQGRLDTPGALVRRGTRSEAEVLPALPVPVLRIPSLPASEPVEAQWVSYRQLSLLGLREALAERLPADEPCEGLAPEDDEDSFFAVHRLAKGKLLVSVRCWLAAYNEGYGYWVVNAAPPYEPELVTTSAVDYDAGEIHAAQKGRGLGDCWWSARWIWNGEYFVQAYEATTGLCRLVAAGGAWSLPTLVSEVVR